MNTDNILTVEVDRVEELETASAWKARHIKVRDAVLKVGGTLVKDVQLGPRLPPEFSGDEICDADSFVMLFEFDGRSGKVGPRVKGRITKEVAEILDGPGMVGFLGGKTVA